MCFIQDFNFLHVVLSSNLESDHAITTNHAHWWTCMSRVIHKTSSKLTRHRRLGRALIVPTKFSPWALVADNAAGTKATKMNIRRYTTCTSYDHGKTNYVLPWRTQISAFVSVNRLEPRAYSFPTRSVWLTGSIICTDQY